MITSEDQRASLAPCMYTVSDLMGAMHSILLETRTLLFDGVPASIGEITDQQISFTTEHGTITCPVDAFGQAVLGENAPTPGDLGKQACLALGEVLLTRLSRRTLERSTT